MDTQTASPRPRTPAEQGALLECLLARHGALLRAQARRHSRGEDDAEDALQDAAVQFLCKFDAPGEDLEDALKWTLVVVKHRAWALGNGAREEARRRIRPPREGWGEDPVQSLPAEAGQGPAQRLALRAELGRKVALFSKLKRDERIALTLFAFGYTYVEIQDRCGWTRTKVCRSCFRLDPFPDQLGLARSPFITRTNRTWQPLSASAFAAKSRPNP